MVPFIVPKRYCRKVYIHRWERKFRGKRKIEPMHIEPELYPFIVDIVVAMNNEVRKRLGAQKFKNNGNYYQ